MTGLRISMQLRLFPKRSFPKMDLLWRKVLGLKAPESTHLRNVDVEDMEDGVFQGWRDPGRISRNVVSMLFLVRFGIPLSKFDCGSSVRPGSLNICTGSATLLIHVESQSHIYIFIFTYLKVSWSSLYLIRILDNFQAPLATRKESSCSNKRMSATGLMGSSGFASHSRVWLRGGISADIADN